MPFRLLEHSADIRVECRGQTIEDLLRSAAEALYAVALRSRRNATDLTRSISLEADSPEDLLVRWLQELIFLLETERFVGAEFRFPTAHNTAVDAEACGYLCKPEERETEVKAATYHGAAIERRAGELVAHMLLDL